MNKIKNQIILKKLKKYLVLLAPHLDTSSYYITESFSQPVECFETFFFKFILIKSE